MGNIKAHSRLSASSSSRWLKCPGSVKLIDIAPKEQSHPSAAIGTAVHKLCENLVLSTYSDLMFDLDKMLDTYIDDILITKEMINSARMFLSVVDESVNDGDEILVEERISLSYIHPEMFGTSDIIIKHKDTSITVIDYKNGTWPVSAKDNPQLMYYFLGARDRDPCIGGCIKIVQPNSRDGDMVKTAHVTKEDIDKWEAVFKSASSQVDLGTPLAKGEWCRFCPAKKICQLHGALPVNPLAKDS